MLDVFQEQDFFRYEGIYPKQARGQNNKPPWMRRDILKLVRLKQRLYNVYMNTKSEYNFTKFKECEKKTKKQFGKLNEDMKRNFLQNKTKNYLTHMSKLKLNQGLEWDL